MLTHFIITFLQMVLNRKALVKKETSKRCPSALVPSSFIFIDFTFWPINVFSL